MESVKLALEDAGHASLKPCDEMVESNPRALGGLPKLLI